MPLQTLHAIEIAISRGAEGKTGKAFIGTMTEEKALESAGKIASEGFILSVRSCCLRSPLQHTPVTQAALLPWLSRVELAKSSVRMLCSRLSSTALLVSQVGIAILGWEYNRQSGKDTEKKQKDAEFRTAILAESRNLGQQQLQVTLVRRFDS